MDEENDTFLAGNMGHDRLRRKPLSSSFLNHGEEDQMTIVGYERNQLKSGLMWVLVVLSLGFLLLVFYWKPDWRIVFSCSTCPLDKAHTLLLTDQYGQCFVEKVSYFSQPKLSSVEEDGHSVAFHSVASASSDLPEVTLDQIHDEQEKCKYFVNKKVKYIWNSELLQFEKLRGPHYNKSCSYFHNSRGLSQAEQSQRQALYGMNSIGVHVTPVVKLLFTQVLNPFYIFQVFSCLLWFMDQYYYFACCIVLISVISIAIQIREMRQTERELKKTIASSDTVIVFRGDSQTYEEVVSECLVPGDIIEVPRHGCVLQCDAVLVNGICIVNESMLTGESVPVTKTPIPNPLNCNSTHNMIFDAQEHSRHILFCGTKVIQTRFYEGQRVRAVVLQTGFLTAKGELVRSIMFPKPVDFKFSQDTFKFIGCLAVIAFIGMVYTLALMISNEEETLRIFVRTLDLVTIVVPPSLPAAMTVGIVFAQKRLRKSLIFCISPRRINLCGAINAFCFDKTGTLTEDGLDMWGVVPVAEQKFAPEVRSMTEMSVCDHVIIAMACCHSLTIIDGEIIGDPMDMKMFEATHWDLDEPGKDTSKFDVFAPTVVKPKTTSANPSSSIVGVDNCDDSEVMPYEVGILRQFTFSSKLQRMSVITRLLGAQNFELYAKGSPEMIISLCNPETVPNDFQEVLMYYTQQGFRVLALGHRVLHKKINYVKVQRIQREQVECKLTFLGLVILENQLKVETTPVIKALKQANIRTIMVTGDNMLTALSVARDCHMIEKHDKVILVTALPSIDDNKKPQLQWTYTADVKDETKDKFSISSPLPSGQEHMVESGLKDSIHFAVTGKSWAVLRRHFSELIPKLVVRGTVFARFSPDQKQQLIESLQEVGYYVGMCGDGANDCGALKAAHSGISLSEAEASVASPFTSKQANITCVPTVIREGRCALVTSFGIFKFMASYSLTQFMAVCILYLSSANLTDWMFLYIDLVLQTTLSITFCYTNSYAKLVPTAPKVSLIAAAPILSIIGQLLINFTMQISVWLYTHRQPWFESYTLPEDPDVRDFTCHEGTALFSVSVFQYIVLAIVFSKGSPYRKSIISNYVFLLNILAATALSLCITLFPPEWLQTLFQLLPAPSFAFRLLLVGLAGVNFFISLIVETFVIRWVVEIGKQFRNVLKKRSKKMYELIEAEMAGQADWPPTSSADLSLSELMKMENMASHSASANANEGNNELDVDSASDTESADLGLRSSRRRLHSARSNSVDPLDDSVVLLQAN